VNVLDAFRIDFGLCMYCGICVDLCPFDALAWSPEHDHTAATAAGLVHGITELEMTWPQERTPTGN
jgi:NADH-quinone oxidoreductase subunit I